MRPAVRFTIGRLMGVVALVALLCWAGTVLGPELFLIGRHFLLAIVIVCAGPCLGAGLVCCRRNDQPLAFLMGSIKGSLITSGIVGVFGAGMMLSHWGVLIEEPGRELTGYAAGVIGTTFLFVCAGVVIGLVFEVVRHAASAVMRPFRKPSPAVRDLVELGFQVDRVRDLFGP
jgi:hypothetical protein